MFQTTNMTLFGKQMRSIRRKCQRSQRDVHCKTGISEDALRKIENGYVVPKYETLETLSVIYRYDLLSLLLTHRYDDFMHNFSSRIDDLLVLNDAEQIELMLDSYTKFKQSKYPQFTFIEYKHIQQYEYFLNGVYNTLSTEQEKLLNAFRMMQTALEITIDDFDIGRFSSYKYNYFEIRVLMIIGVISLQVNKVELAGELLKFCLDYIKSLPAPSKGTEHLIVKLHFNLAYYYHTSDEHGLAEDCCLKGIQYARECDTMFGLAPLYYRLGIAQYLQKKDDYFDSLKKAMTLLDINNQVDLIKQYRSITHEKYGIQI